jgi:hypothetical protein
MRTLATQEIGCICGGTTNAIEWRPFDSPFTSDEVAGAYDWAVDQMSDFFTCWDPAGYYSGC